MRDLMRALFGDERPQDHLVRLQLGAGCSSPSFWLRHGADCPLHWCRCVIAPAHVLLHRFVAQLFQGRPWSAPAVFCSQHRVGVELRRRQDLHPANVAGRHVDRSRSYAAPMPIRQRCRHRLSEPSACRATCLVLISGNFRSSRMTASSILELAQNRPCAWRPGRPSWADGIRNRAAWGLWRCRRPCACWCGAVPTRALPVPFWRNSFLVLPATSPRRKVECVPARWLARYIKTTSCSSCRLTSPPNSAGSISTLPTDSPAVLKISS